MRFNKPAALGLAAVTAASLGAAAITGSAGAGASTPAKMPTVVVHVSSSAISLSTGSTLHAGRVMFKVETFKGDHTLQILRLHKGYTLAQAGADINKAFGGDVAAIRRVDSHVTFRGGAEARPDHPGRFVVTLKAARYIFLDQNSNAVKGVTVFGTPPARTSIAAQGSITAYSYGFGSSAKLPANGWIHFFDQSDQPHFLEIQHVKASTTNAMVRKALTPTNQSQPSWALGANTSAGVVSPYNGELLHVNLPPGKYLIACFWPDDDTGMPHAFMGMWKLVWLT